MFLAVTVPEIWRGSQNFKIRSRDPFPTCKWGVAGDPIFNFLAPTCLFAIQLSLGYDND